MAWLGRNVAPPAPSARSLSFAPPSPHELVGDRHFAARRDPDDEHPAGARRLAALIAPLYAERALPRARGLLDAFGSLSALLRSNRSLLARELPGEEDLVTLIAGIRPLIRELLLEEMLGGAVLPNNDAARDYLFVALAHEPAEQVRMLYLDAKNRIIAQEVATRGSVTKTDLAPREIIRRALELGATGLIMAHNHPSGDPQPSRSDLKATHALAEAARLFDICLHDHIIVGRAGCVSLRGEGYLDM